MSLINKMLQDLDARRAGGGDAVPDEVRPLPVADQARPARLRLVAIAVATTAIGAAAWWALEYQLAAPTPAVLPRLSAGVAEVPISRETAAPAAPDLGPAVAPPPPTIADAPAAATPVAEPASAVAETPQPQLQADALRNEGLRLSRALLLSANDPRLAAPAPQAAAPAAAPAPAPTSAPASAKPSAAPVRVEKNVRPMSALDQAELVYRKAVSQLGLDQRGAAVETLRAALALDGGHASARQLLVRLLLEDQREADGLALLEEGVRRYPEQVQWSLYLARIELERRGPVVALETLRQGQEPAGGSHEYRGFLAALLQQTGQYAPAIDTYRQALALAPAEGRYWAGLGMAQEASGQRDAAADSYRRARGAINLPADLKAFVDDKLR